MDFEWTDQQLTKRQEAIAFGESALNLDLTDFVMERDLRDATDGRAYDVQWVI